MPRAVPLNMSRIKKLCCNTWSTKSNARCLTLEFCTGSKLFVSISRLHTVSNICWLLGSGVPGKWNGSQQHVIVWPQTSTVTAATTHSNPHLPEWR